MADMLPETGFGVLAIRRGRKLVLPLDGRSRSRVRVSGKRSSGAEGGGPAAFQGRRGNLEGAAVSDAVGDGNCIGSLSETAIRANRLRTEFRKEVLAEASHAAEPMTGERKDLRDPSIVTIAPPRARGRDDAVFAEPDEDPSDPGGHAVRASIGALDLGDDGAKGNDSIDLAEMARHLSETERVSELSERDTFDRLATSFVADRVGHEASDMIVSVARFGAFVRIDATGAEGLIPTSRPKNERFRPSGSGRREGPSGTCRFWEQ